MTEENIDELQIIKTVDENGDEVELKLLDIVSVDETDYALLLPADEEEGDSESEVVLMRLKKDGEEYIFETIEDDDEFNMVAKILADDEECECEGECDCEHHNH